LGTRKKPSFAGAKGDNRVELDLVRLIPSYQQIPVNLHFLGTTGYHPNENRHTACLMIPEKGIILDAGTGMFRARDLIETDTLDIFLSHVHLDHSIGLTFLYNVLFDKNLSRVTVHVAEDKISAIRDHLYSSALFPVEPNYEIVPIQPSILVEDVEIKSLTLDHPGGSHGFVLTHSNGSLAYITDTTAKENADYIQHIKNVDVLVHECYFPDGWEDKAKLTGHSCLTPVAKIAASADAGRLILVHINPLNESEQPLDLKTVEEIFAETDVAKDRMIVPL